MIFERSLDELVEYIWGDKLVYVGAGEIVCERLERNILHSFQYE